MSNSLVANATKKSALEEQHQLLGATMEEREGWTIPASYGDVPKEYAAVRGDGAGLIDLSSRGRIHVGGAEAVSFLNGLITNDVKTLETNHWMPAVFPNVQGRVIASVRVTHLPGGFLIDTEQATHQRVLEVLQRFTLAGDFQVNDRTDETVLMSLQGMRSSDIAHSILGESVVAMPRNGAMESRWQQSELTIIRATHTGEDGFDVYLASSQATLLWESFIKEGARPVGHRALDILKIEAGLPRFGTDFDENTVVLEAGLDEAVSYTKGCYIGQEIIARIKYRGHVAKRLSGIILAPSASIEGEATIRSVEGKDIGRLTSVTSSPQLGRTIALGYVKYDYLATGTPVSIVCGESEFPAEVRELPFLRGSWSPADQGSR